MIVPLKIPQIENERVDEITTAAADSMSCTYREGEPCHVVYMSISRSLDCYLHFKHCPFFFQKKRINIWGTPKVLFDTTQGCNTERGESSHVSVAGNPEAGCSDLKCLSNRSKSRCYMIDKKCCRSGAHRKHIIIFAV